MNRTSLKDLGELVTSGKLKIGSIKVDEPLIRDRTADDIVSFARARMAATGEERAPFSLLEDAVRDAYELGKKHGTSEAALTLLTIGEVNDKRAAHLLPACVAAIMEQSGMTAMELDLGAVATVFTRCTIDSTMGTVDGQPIMQYRLGHKADGAA